MGTGPIYCRTHNCKHDDPGPDCLDFSYYSDPPKPVIHHGPVHPSLTTFPQVHPWSKKTPTQFIPWPGEPESEPPEPDWDGMGLMFPIDDDS